MDGRFQPDRVAGFIRTPWPDWPESIGWSAELAAVTFTIAETAKQNGVDPLHFLQKYLGACAEQGGKPPQDEALARFRCWLKPAVRQGEDTS